MALIKIEDVKKCYNVVLGPFDVVYFTGKILVVNPLYYRSKASRRKLSIIKRLIQEYRVVMYANYVFNRSKHMLYSVQPDHISVDLLYHEYSLLKEARIIIASSITRTRSLDESVIRETSILRPSTKALLNIRNYINKIIMVKDIEPYNIIVLSVNEFGPLININSVSSDWVNMSSIELVDL